MKNALVILCWQQKHLTLDLLPRASKVHHNRPISMDPVTILTNCYTIYEGIQTKIDTVVSNRHQFVLLKSKVAQVREPLAQLTRLQKENRLPCSQQVLIDFHKLLTDITEFVNLKRFQQESKSISALRWISEAYNSADDQAQFAEFDRLISSHLQSLNLHITVQLLDFARAAHQDSAKATAEVHSLELHMIDTKKLVWDPAKAKNKIGEGTFSTVTVGQYNKEYVAIKQVRQMDKMSASDIKTITKEAQIMQYANHKNILSVKGVHMAKGIIVMELAVCSLADYLYHVDAMAQERARPLLAAAAVPTEQWRLDVIRDVCDAVRYLHAHNILHRDIKSPNLLLFRDPASGKTTAKLGDFGLALAVEIASRTAGTSSAGGAVPTVLRAVGTYSYMAPELFDREPGQRIPYSEASDVYSLGVLVNEIMRGATPWEASAREADIMNWVLNKRRRPRLWEMRTDASAQKVEIQHILSLRALVGCSDGLHCCWSHQPAQRCTAEDLYVALTSLTEQPSVAADVALPVPPPPAKVTEPAPASTTDVLPPKPFSIVREDITARAKAAEKSSPTRSSKLFSFFQQRNAVEPVEQQDPEIAQRMEEFALELVRTFPAIRSSNARTYAATLFGRSIYTVPRLLGQVQEQVTQGEAAYQKWTSELGIDTFDALDMRSPASNSTQWAQATFVTLDAQHGADRLVEWLALCVPDLPVPTKRRQIAEALCAANVTCCARLVLRVRDVPWLEKLGVDRLDAEDIVDATARGAVHDASLASVPGLLGEASREMIVAAFAADLRCTLIDLRADNAQRYCPGLYDKGIYTISRLSRVLRSQGKPFLKQLQWHDFDTDDAIYLLRTDKQGVKKLESEAAVDALHGVEALSLWMLDHVPNITLSKIRTSYCKALVEHNISTVHRLVLHGCNEAMLTNIGVSKLDAVDIVAALQLAHNNEPCVLFAKQEAAQQAAQKILQKQEEEAAAQQKRAAAARAVQERQAKQEALRNERLASLREQRPASQWQDDKPLVSEYLCCKPYCEFLLEPEQLDALLCSTKREIDFGQSFRSIVCCPAFYPAYCGLCCCRLVGNNSFTCEPDCVASMAAGVFGFIIVIPCCPIVGPGLCIEHTVRYCEGR